MSFLAEIQINGSYYNVDFRYNPGIPAFIGPTPETSVPSEPEEFSIITIWHKSGPKILSVHDIVNHSSKYYEMIRDKCIEIADAIVKQQELERDILNHEFKNAQGTMPKSRRC